MRWPGGLRLIGRAWVLHPRAGLALRTAAAAGLAWFVAQLVPGPAGEYPYYAPLGAVVATGFTLAGSVRDSLRAVAAIVLGAVIATMADQWFGPSPWTVAGVVLLGSLSAGLRVLGTFGTLVPTAALFVLVIGTTDPVGFVGSYAGLTLLGAGIGVLITLVVPQNPLAPAQVALRRMTAALVDQLAQVADGLDDTEAPDETEWRERSRSLEPLVWRMRDQLHALQDAQRWNPWADRFRATAEQYRLLGSTLERVVGLVEELTMILRNDELAGNTELALGSELRPSVAEALRGLAAVLEAVGDTDAEAKAALEADRLYDDLITEVRRVGSDFPDSTLFVAGTVVTALRHSLGAISAARKLPGPPTG